MRFFETVFAEKKVQLDLLDKKILFELSKNARLSQSAMAKNIGSSRDTVNYRINNLKKSGVLQAYRTLVNISKFDYLNFHVFLQLKQPTKEAFAELIKKLKEYVFLRAIIQFNGKYDLELALVAKDIVDCDRIITQICNDCQHILQNYEVLFLTKTFAANTFPRSFYQKEIEEKKTQKEEYKLDSNDIKILELLSDTADLPVYKIAEKINLSADAVTYRIKKLQKSDYILGYMPAINYNIITYNVYAVLVSITSLTQKEEYSLNEFLRTNKDILWAVKTIGKYNLILYICTQKMDDFIKTTQELRNFLINKIKDYETLINFEEYKYTYLPKGLVKI
jgi:DNA-binding Lrp family transcriptional regulator